MTSRSNVYLSLGSNIDPQNNLLQAVELLRTKVTVAAISPVFRTTPQGYADQADFLNMAVLIQTDLSPITLKHDVLDWVEHKLKRQRDPNNKNAPRTIDLDISLWDNAVFEYGVRLWRVPDPDILRFAHVAIPLAAIAPNYIHPTEKRTLAQIAAGFRDAKFERVPLRFEG
ncbi:MAG: 2-amino-4-hydroxy-6-hydroxymethyldihydropteridine diphosphokinase [Anaerolineae bacterium]|nr:2-amino-4-hydroxy-6-hydroxymethyldihydropteridine diphosphokinase [Anaerolineae bacterium]